MLALVVRRILFLALLLPLAAHAEYYPSTADPCAEHHFTDCDPVCSPGAYCVLDQVTMRDLQPKYTAGLARRSVSS